MIRQEPFKEASSEFLNPYLSAINWADKHELKAKFSDKEEILSNARAIPERILFSKTSKSTRIINGMTMKYSTCMPYVRSGDKVLDLCAGSGFGSNILANSGYKVTAVDQFTDILRYRSNIGIYKGDVRDLSLFYDSFQAVHLVDCIEHFTQEDQLKVLEEAAKTLKDTGYLIIDTPHTKVSAYGSKNHLWELSWQDFSDLVRSAGFLIVKKYQTRWMGDTGIGAMYDCTDSEPEHHDIADQIIVAVNG